MLVLDPERDAAGVRLVQEPERLDDDGIAELGCSRARLVRVTDPECRGKNDPRGSQKLACLPIAAADGLVACGRRELRHATRRSFDLVHEPSECPGRGLDLAVDRHAGFPERHKRG